MSGVKVVRPRDLPDLRAFDRTEAIRTWSEGAVLVSNENCRGRGGLGLLRAWGICYKPFLKAINTHSMEIHDVSLLMGELRALARGLLKGERDAGSLRPTALVMSALRRNKGQGRDWTELRWENRKHFFASMHKAMREALTDHARKRNAAKRPRLEFIEPKDLDLYDLPSTLESYPERIVALGEALHWLNSVEPELVEYVEYHYFTGAGVEEIARFLDVSSKTVKRRLAAARLLLHKRILEILNA